MSNIPVDIFVYANSDCPRCDIIKAKLTNKGLKFHVIDKLTDGMKEDLAVNGFALLPVVSFDGELMNFGRAIKFIESM